MTAKEKAKELYEKYRKIKMSTSVYRSKDRAKECAIILCDEMIESLAHIEDNYQVPTPTGWWNEVKKEITKL